MSNTIHVVMTCYNRPELAGQTAHRLYNLLRVFEFNDKWKINLHVADDGSDDLQKLLDTIEMAWPSGSDMYTKSWSSALRLGIGGSLNKAIQRLLVQADGSWSDDLWMYITDDWLLTHELDLSPAIKLIQNEHYDMVRLAPLHPDLECKTRFNANIGWWLDIDASAGGYAFATRPFLANSRLCKIIGHFMEGVNAYDAERDYAERVCLNNQWDLMAEHKINIAAIIPYGMHGPWEHIGKEYDVGRITPNAG